MMKRICWICILCIPVAMRAQNTKPALLGLGKDDTIPGYIWEKPLEVINFPGGKKTIRLQDYRDRIIVLDFWATWCKPCVASLDNLNDLQKKFDTKELIVLPVLVRDNAERGMPFIRKKEWQLPSVFNDTVLDRHMLSSEKREFGFGAVILQDGKIRSIPKPVVLNEYNFRKLVNGEDVVLEEATTEYQKDLDNLRRPLLYSEQGKGADRLFYFTGFTSFLPGVARSGVHYLQQGDTTILTMRNEALHNLLYSAFEQEIHPLLDYRAPYGDNANGKAIIWEISDTLHDRLFRIPQRTGIYEQDKVVFRWQDENMYCYNMFSTHPIKKDTAIKWLQQDINRFFGDRLGIHAQIEMRSRKFVVLRYDRSAKGAANALRPQQGDFVNGLVPEEHAYIARNTAIKYVGNLLRRTPVYEAYEVIDSTGLSPDTILNYRFPEKAATDDRLLNRELGTFGLSARLEDVQVPVLVVRQLR